MKVRKFNEDSSIMKVYWKLKNSEPYLSVGLDNIGAPKGKYNFLPEHYKDMEYILICCDDYNRYDSTTSWELWGWNRSADDQGNWDWFDQHGYIYMGEVPVSEEELNAWEFKKNINKYNL